MKDSVLTSVVLPLALFLIMLGMGLSLTPRDFKRVAKVPQAAAAGLFCQLLLLPILGYGLIHIFGFGGALAVGLMIIAACPGGVTSNLITHVSRGDTALSITLTAITSFVTVLTIPLIISASLGEFMQDSQAVSLPILQTIGQVVAITILPVSIGMFIRSRAPEFAKRMDRPSRIASSVIFIVLVLGIIIKERQLIQENFMSLVGITLALNVLTMAAGFGLAKLLKLSSQQVRTIAIEGGIQNGTLALVIASSILKQPEMAIPGGIYSLVMFGTGGLMMLWGARSAPAEAAATA